MTNTQGSKKSQSQKFIDKAKELGCDEDEEAFERKLGQIAKASLPDKESTKKKAPAK